MCLKGGDTNPLYIGVRECGPLSEDKKGGGAHCGGGGHSVRLKGVEVGGHTRQNLRVVCRFNIQYDAHLKDHFSRPWCFNTTVGIPRLATNH
jgi:hypothetical protein